VIEETVDAEDPYSESLSSSDEPNKLFISSSSVRTAMGLGAI